MVARKQCYYEVLEVSFKATQDEIKKAYRKKALQWHPDKSRDLTPDEANKRFQVLQEAYETLSNPQEREWYDGHRDEILGGQSSGFEDGTTGYVNLWGYFSRSCFESFNDAETGFYMVYEKIFQAVDAEDISWSSRVRARPFFGTSTTSWSDVNTFYREWSDFVTNAPFGHAAKWKLSDAPNRDIRRIMEAENRKLQSEARKAYNELVRRLVEWVRRRDPRVLEHTQKVMRDAMLAAEAAEADRLRKAQELAAARAAARAEELAGAEERKREREILKAAGQVFFDSEDETSKDIKDSITCSACRKSFKSRQQAEAHMRSKKHVQTCRKAGMLVELEFGESADSKAHENDKEIKKDADAWEEQNNMRSPVLSASRTDENLKESDAGSALEHERPETSSEHEGTDVEVSKSARRASSEKEVGDKVDIKLEDEPHKKTDLDGNPAKRSKRRRAAKETRSSADFRCLVCGETFDSRNKMYKHVNEKGHTALKSDVVKQGKGKRR